MIAELSVRMTPLNIAANELPGRWVVMTDVLRASTTIIHSLANGASAVYPVAEIEQARMLANRLGTDALLGGERGGQIVPGFDCGNSPLEYTCERIADKKLVLCTTNGTFTLRKCEDSARVLIGAFVNLTAVCELLEQSPAALIACAGTDRMVTDEDVLFAGAATEKLLLRNPDLRIDDSARIALNRWQTVATELASGRPLWDVLADGHGGRNLTRLRYDQDIKFCAELDLFSVVPELDLRSWIIQTSPIVPPVAPKPIPPKM